ncbi:MAG: hypothetical protein LBQ69_00825 [Treponema sp.]|nr:hypothetical protein [Treponema sp.]
MSFGASRANSGIVRGGIIVAALRRERILALGSKLDYDPWADCTRLAAG